MKTKVSPAVVGLFVLGALILGIGALLMFGGVHFFSQPLRFVVSFNESIHGLDLGSPVKLRGVRVGRVVGLNVRYDEKQNRSVVRVLCELNSDVVKDGEGNIIDVSDQDELQHLVDKGLRAQLGVLGLATGLLFVELDFVDPHQYPADLRVTETKYAVVPAMTSTISEFQANLTEILNDIRKVDFAGIGRETKQLLVDTRKQLNGVDMKGLVDQWKSTGASLDTLARSPEIKEAVTNLNRAVVELRTVLSHLDAQVGPAGENLTATLAEAKKAVESFDVAAQTAQKFIASQTGLSDEAVRTMEQLSEAADSVKRLADFLERNPNALLTGKKRP
jgi:paraquat-inducible protein B